MLDPITKAVLWNSFVAIAEESGAVLQRTAFSPVIREANDLSSAIFDRRGRMIGQGTFAIGHLGSMNRAVDAIVNMFRDSPLKPGDAIVFNDPQLGAGHLPDVYVVSPVFWNDTHVGYAGTTAHQIDLGGATPGSHSITGVEELIQEGLRLMPVHLYREGRAVNDVFSIIRANSRMPDYVERDLHAQVIALRSAEQRLAELYQHYGEEQLEEAIDQLLDWSERAVRRGIEAIPDGEYEAEDFLDGWGQGTAPIRLHVTVRISGSEAEIDFDGTDPQVPAAINSYLNYTFSYAYFALKCIAAPFVSQNEGCLRPVTVKAPLGSVLNPRHGAPCAGRAVFNFRIFELMMQALAPARPDRVVAPGSQVFNLCFGGTDDDGEPWVCYKFLLSSFGGRAGSDAPDGMTSLVNTANFPIEAIEATYPLRIEQLGFVPDRFGPGRFRASASLRCDIRILTNDVVFTLGTDRHRFAPNGILEGAAGTVASSELVREGEMTPLDSKGTYRLGRNDIVRLTLAGGGGYGPAGERDIRSIEADIAEGLVTADWARANYSQFRGDESPQQVVKEAL